MADDNNARYRSNEPFGRGPAQGAPANDPLAELARLIGQSDPFSEYGRESRPPAQPAAGPVHDSSAAPSYDSIPAPPYGSEPAPRYAEPAPRYAEPAPPQYSAEPTPRYADPTPRYADPAPQYAEPAPRYSEPAPQYGHDPNQSYSQPAAPRHAADYPPRYADNQAAHDDWPGSPAAPSYPASAPFVPPPQQYAPPPATPHYEHQQGYPNPNFASQPYADPRAGFGPAAGFPAPPLYPHEPEAGGMPPPHDDEFYDDEPRGGRRKGLLTVVAVLALAVIGTAGAFGYRSIFGSQGFSGPPPVIRASGEPSKVAPPPAAPDATAGKFSYDRFGDAGKDEQVVRREEKPVDLSKAAPPPRTVFPGAPVPSASVAKQAGSATTATANPPSAIGEPRRVRTVPIRPDQGGDVASTPPAQRPATVAPPRQANAAASSAAASGAADDQPPAAARPAAPPRASSRVASRPSPPQAAPAPSGNAPLSLSPEGNGAPAQESFPPPPRASAPTTRVASAPAAAPASGGGSYLVQVSSQKSEADAESAYRGIKSKYSSVLGSHPHQVRRADLGTKGIFYRAMVGPFGSREAAVQVCSSLKQAGGDCVVQH